VATISRLLKIIGLFGRISSLLYGTFSSDTTLVIVTYRSLWGSCN